MPTKMLPAAIALALAFATLAPPPCSAASVTTGEGARESQRLGELAGLWNVRQSLWLTPGPPQQDTGTAMFSVVLAGRALQQDLRIGSATPFQGLGFTGYDVGTQSYFTSWMDVNPGGVLVLHGDYDESTRTYRFSGAMSSADGAKVPTREELRIVDSRHLIARYFEVRNGIETMVVELSYSRP